MGSKLNKSETWVLDHAGDEWFNWKDLVIDFARDDAAKGLGIIRFGRALTSLVEKGVLEYRETPATLTLDGETIEYVEKSYRREVANERATARAGDYDPPRGSTYFAVPDHYTIGRRFRLFAEAAESARSTITEIEGCPGEFTRAFVHTRVLKKNGSDRVKSNTEIFRDRLATYVGAGEFYSGIGTLDRVILQDHVERDHLTFGRQQSASISLADENGVRVGGALSIYGDAIATSLVFEDDPDHDGEVIRRLDEIIERMDAYIAGEEKFGNRHGVQSGTKTRDRFREARETFIERMTDRASV